MEPSLTVLVYQNQLFAESLETVLLQSNYKVLKKTLNNIKELSSEDILFTSLLIFEANWPFPRLENILDEIESLIGANKKTILISNLINKSIFRLVQKHRIHGIILKQSSLEEFLFGIKQVFENKIFYSSAAANVIMKNNLEPPNVQVSGREKQILSLLAGMNSTEEIANKLSITKSTVKTHRRNLMRKFNAKNILCLLRFACRENLLNEENDFCGCCYKQFVGA